MLAKGKFTVEVLPQNDGEFNAGRLTISKTYTGDIVGTGKGQMISKRIENGPATYFAIEEVSATLNDKTGSFTLLHKGVMDANGTTLDITIMPHSGTDDFAGITGTYNIIQQDGQHFYELEWALAD